MPSRRDGLPAKQPALLPLHGNTDKKPRPLDRDVTTIGRARGSDLCLDANEISTVHCLVFRTPEGYRIRDCHSRTGTRVNGEKVRAGALHDGDVLNVGPFSFEVKIPREVFDPDIRHFDPMRVKHWQDSRRRFAEYALVLRQRTRHPGAEGSDRRAELEVQVVQLRDKIRAYDQRAGQLEAAERELETEKAALAAERDAVEGRVQKVEKELAQRLAAVDQEIHRRWQEFQQRCQAEEERQQRELEERLVRQQQEVPAAPVLNPADDQRARRLDDRERQLEHQLDELQRDRQEFFRMKDESDREEAARAELSAALKAQKTELARMIAELRQLQESVRQQQSADVQTLADENQQLRQVVAVYEQRLAHDAAPAHAAEQQRLLDDLRAENELLRELLDEKEKAPSAPADSASEIQAQLDDLHVENDLLKQVLRQKDEQVEDMRRRAAPAPVKHDDELERYEAELNQFRQQLEADRSKMQHEIEQLRVKNEELEETTREVEMQFSRERAEMARERIRLERLRDEIKADSEKMQREMSMRDSLASVQKLRDEIKKNGSAEKPPDKSAMDRLRAFRSNGSDHGN